MGSLPYSVCDDDDDDMIRFLRMQATSCAKAKKKKRKDKSKSEEGVVAPDLMSGTYKIKAFELKDVSELETPKLSPRAEAISRAHMDVMKSTEGFSELPEDEPDEVMQSADQAPAVARQLSNSAPTPTGISSAMSTGMSTDRATEDVNYSDDEFASVSASVTASNKYSTSGSDSRRAPVGDLSEPDLSPISYVDSEDDQGHSDMMNIKSLSELGSSIDDITSAGN